MIRSKTLVDNRSHASMKAFYDKLKGYAPNTYEVYICEKKKTRSGKQRRYYWAVVVKLISDHTGYSPDEVNEILKFKFNKKEVQMPDGSFIKVGSSIEKESTKRVEEIQESVRQWAAQDMDLQIPEPNQVDDIDIIELHGLYNI